MGHHAATYLKSLVTQGSRAVPSRLVSCISRRSFSAPAALQIDRAPVPWPKAAEALAPEPMATSSALTLAAMRSVIESGVEDPFFVVDINAALERIALWRALLPRVAPFYAVKCNPDPMLLAAFAEHGVNFDCASRAEISEVLDLGVSPRRIIYANPMKQPSHLRYARDEGVTLTVADSEAELR